MEGTNHGVIVVLSSNLPEAAEEKMEISDRIADVPAEFQTEDFTHEVYSVSSTPSCSV
jgi:hypothetical protein